MAAMEPSRGERGVVEAGVVEAQGCPKAPMKDVSVLLLLRLRDQIQQQLMECSSAVQAGQENYLDHVTEEHLTMTATDGLEKDLEEVKVALQNKILTLKRIQIMDALRNKMEQNDNDSRKIVETAEDILKLSITIINYQLQVREKEQNFADIKKKRYLLKKAAGQKLQQIHALMKLQKEEQASTEVSRTLESNLEKEREITTIIQNIFQGIIIGSKVNWAEDPSLKAIVLQLEKNVNFL